MFFFLAPHQEDISTGLFFYTQLSAVHAALQKA